MPSRKPAATNFPTSSPTAVRAMSPAATPTPASPPKNSAGAPNSASKPCAPTPGAGSPTTPKATAKPSLYRAHPLRTRGGCSYGSGVGLVFVVGAPPRCERGRAQTLLTHTSPCTTSQPRHPLLYSCPHNPLDISKSPIQEAQCRVTSNLPIPSSASWARVRGWQAVPHYRRYPGSRAGFLRSEQRPDSGQYLAYGGAGERCPDLVLCRDAGSFPLVDAVE